MTQPRFIYGLLAFALINPVLSEDAETRCTTFDGVENIVSKPWSSPTCSKRVAIVEVYPFHDEVIPSAVKLMQASGADCVAMLKLQKGSREYDIFVEVKKWAPNLEIVRGLQDSFDILEAGNLDAVMINTFQSGNQAFMSTVTKIIKAVSKSEAKIMLGCHNLETFLTFFEFIMTHRADMRFAVFTYHPEQTRQLLRAEAFQPYKPYTNVFTMVPFYFAPKGLTYRDPAVTEGVIRFLSVGELTSERRNYDVISMLSRVTINRPIELAFFGKDPDNVKEFLIKEAELLPNVSVAFYTGNYSLMYALAESSAFIVTYIDRTRPLIFDQYRDGKLSSSLALATGFLKPVLACKEIMRGYGLDEPGQILLDRIATNFGEAMVAALQCYEDRHSDSSSPNGYASYTELRASQCDFRTSLFLASKRVVKEALDNASRGRLRLRHRLSRNLGSESPDETSVTMETTV